MCDIGPAVQFREEYLQFAEGVENIHGSIHPKLSSTARQKIIDIAREHHKDGKIGSSQGKDFMVTNNRLPAFHQAMAKAGFAQGRTGHYIIH